MELQHTLLLPSNVKRTSSPTKMSSENRLLQKEIHPPRSHNVIPPDHIFFGEGWRLFTRIFNELKRDNLILNKVKAKKTLWDVYKNYYKRKGYVLKMKDKTLEHFMWKYCSKS